MRQIIYGYDPSTTRLQRFFEITKRTRECYQERIEDNLDGVEVNLINLHHLKVNKKANGIHKDLDDLGNLS